MCESLDSLIPSVIPPPATAKEREEMLKKMEKPWLRSKKFYAFLLMEVAMFALMFLLIYFTKVSDNTEMTWQESALAITMVFVMGFCALAFNNMQGSLDKFVRGIALVGSVNLKDGPK